MAKNKLIKLSINLLPKDPFFQSSLGRVLKWALSAGRYIVIFTELIVILSFVARFTLDRQITDLNAEIHQNEQIIKSYGSLEENFRTAQTKIQTYQQIEQETNMTDVFPNLSEVTPESVTLDELVVKQDLIIASGETESRTAFNVFVNNLQLSPHFFNVTIDNIESSDENENAIVFRLKADTKEEAQVKTNPRDK